MSGTKYTIVTLENSRSLRMLWLFEELGLDYELREFKRGKDLWAPADVKKIHPLGKVPVVTWQEHGKDRVLAESGAITEYLIEKHGNGKLTGGADKRDQYLYWLHYAEGSLMPQCYLHIVLTQVYKQGCPCFSVMIALNSLQAPVLAYPLLRPIMGAIQAQTSSKALKMHVAFIENELDGKDFLLGPEVSGADILLSYPLQAIEPLGLYKDAPNIRSYLERIRARPAHKRAEEKIGAVDHSTWL